MQADREITDKFPSFLRGGGEIGKLIRSQNWQLTSLGDPHGWPQSLRTTLSIILNSRFPMFLYWGVDHICFYNDAYRPSFGINGKHPFALGKKGMDVWPELWEDMYPRIKAILDGREASWNEDQSIPIYRNGKIEDVYWTFSSSPVFDESGSAAGVFVTCIETTSQVIARRELEINKHDLTVAIEIAELGTYRLDIATDNVSISERIMNWFGFKDQNVPLQLLKSIVHPNDSYRAAKSLNDTTKSKNANRHDIQYTVVDPRNGKERHLRSIGKAVFEGETAVAIEGILQDITEQAIVQKKIELSEQRFRNLIRYATVGVVVLLGPNQVVDIANEFYCQVINKPYKELIRKPLFDVIPEMDGNLRKQINRVRTSGVPLYLYEQPFVILKDGGKKEIYVNLVFQPLKENSEEISGVVILVHDVTEQVTARRDVEYAEQRARLAVDTAGLGVYEVNLLTDDMIADLNFHRIYGLEQKASRAEFLSTVHPEDLHIRNDAHTLSTRTGHLKYECRLLWKDQTIHWVHVEGKLFFDDDHIPVRLLGVVQDITKQKIAEEELERKVAARTKALAEANHQLNKTNTELNQFAYIASHDLQEPLRKITTYAGMLASILHEKPPEELNYIKKIMNSANRMKTLIHDVLAFSQISEGSKAFQATDLNAVLDDIKDDYELMIAQKAALITNDPLPVVDALPLQMSQLFANLISNALKFNKQDLAPEISIRVQPATDEELKHVSQFNPSLTYCAIRFQDNGIGFNAEYAERIFTIFQRLHNKEIFDGTGIGLAICRKIALNHNGYISASSQPGNGALFVFILPLQQSPQVINL